MPSSCTDPAQILTEDGSAVERWRRRVHRRPFPRRAIFFWPVLTNEEPFVHLSLGISDENGEITEARLLPPGHYELFTTPGRHYTAFDPGEGGPRRYDYRSVGRITWPRDGKPKTVEVHLPANDSESR